MGPTVPTAEKASLETKLPTNHVVQLLKDVARQQRQRKANQMAGDIAFGHIHAGVGRMRVLDMVHSLAFLYMIFV